MNAPTLSLVHVLRPAAPDANPAGARPPLLILLHGVGGNERAVAALAPSFDGRFIVVSARSPIELGPDAFGWFHVTFASGGPVIDPTEAEAGWGVVARFADEAVLAYEADPARVFIAGFSQGGIMSLAALLTAPDRFAGAVCMSGRLLPEVLPHAASADALRGKPAMIVHGSLDEKLGVHFARTARERLEALGLDVTYVEPAMRHQITPQSLARVSEWLSARLDEPVTA